MLATGFLQDFTVGQSLDSRRGSWKAELRRRRYVLDREDRICLGKPVDTESGRSATSEALDLLYVSTEQPVDFDRRLYRLIRGAPHSLKKEIQLFFPVMILAGSVEPVLPGPS